MPGDESLLHLAAAIGTALDARLWTPSRLSRLCCTTPDSTTNFSKLRVMNLITKPKGIARDIKSDIAAVVNTYQLKPFGSDVVSVMLDHHTPPHCSRLRRASPSSAALLQATQHFSKLRGRGGGADSALQDAESASQELK